MLVNQVISQYFGQSGKQPECQSIKSAYHAIRMSVNRSIFQSTIPILLQSINQSANHSITSVVDDLPVGGGASVGDSCELAADNEVFTGFLSNRLSSTTSKLCGSTESPWTIRVLPGQRINLTLLDFSSGLLSLKSQSPVTPCDLYAVLQEADGVSGTNVCGTGRVQSLHAYTSVGNSLKVILKPRKVNSTNNFVFRYDGE